MYNVLIWGLIGVSLFFIYVSTLGNVSSNEACISGICVTDINTVTSQCIADACMFNLDGSKVITVLDHAYSWTVGGNCIMVEQKESGVSCINSFYFEKSQWNKNDYMIDEKHVTVFSKR